MEASACRIQALIARVEEQLSEAGLSGEVDFISEDGAVLVSEAGSTNGSPPGESESSMIRSGGTAPADEWSGGPRLETSNLEPTGGHVSLRVVRGGGENHDQISVHAANSSSSITIAHAPPPGQHPPPSHKPQSPPSKEGKSSSFPASPAVPLTASTPFKAESHVCEPASSSSPIREPTSPYIPPKPPLFDLQTGSVVLEPALKMSSPIREPAFKPSSPPGASLASSDNVAPHEEQAQRGDPGDSATAAAATTDDNAAAPVGKAPDTTIVQGGDGGQGALTGGGGEASEGAGKTGSEGDAGRESETQVCGGTAVLEAKKEGAVDEGGATASKGDAAVQGAEGGGKPKGKKGKKKK